MNGRGHVTDEEVVSLNIAATLLMIGFFVLAIWAGCSESEQRLLHEHHQTRPRF